MRANSNACSPLQITTAARHAPNASNFSTRIKDEAANALILEAFFKF
jgi:hypothetical protein